MVEIEVRAVTAGDLPQLTRVMARAFFDDPCMAWVFRDEARRLDDLHLLFETASAVHVPHGLSVATADLAGVALWAPPGGHNAEEAVIAPFSARMAERYDGAAMGRLGEFFALTDQHHPQEPHYYLGVLAADKGRQGEGLGSACLRAVLPTVDADRAPAYLESSNEKNVPLYERHGFEVVAKATIGGADGPPVFFMWRPAQ